MLLAARSQAQHTIDLDQVHGNLRILGPSAFDKLGSPVVVENQVVGFSHFRKGQLFGLNPNNGEVLWRGESKWGEHASLISWGDELLVLREDGSLIAGKVPREGFQSQRRYRLGSFPMWGHPAIVDGRIIIKDGSQLKVYRVCE